MSPSPAPAPSPLEFAIAPWSGGFFLLACRKKQVCALLLGSDPEALRAELRGAFPQSSLLESAAALKSLMTAAGSLLDGKEGAASPPLALEGTPFQKLVWEELQKIPAGQTRSYGEVAAAIGLPSAARAVGSACAANTVALLVPCHRVTRRSGVSGGYRWGAATQALLLSREASADKLP